MSHEHPNPAPIAAISDLEEETVLALARQRLDSGHSPLLVIRGCQEGLRQVGLLCERHEYCLPALIEAGEIFREAMELAQPVIERHVSGKMLVRVLVGTVKGDIHHLGKHTCSVLLGCHSFAVQDLCVDVPPRAFVSRPPSLCRTS